MQLSLVKMSKISPQTSHDTSSLQAVSGATLATGGGISGWYHFRDRILASQSGTYPEGPGVWRRGQTGLIRGLQCGQSGIHTVSVQLTTPL